MNHGRNNLGKIFSLQADGSFSDTTEQVPNFEALERNKRGCLAWRKTHRENMDY